MPTEGSLETCFYRFSKQKTFLKERKKRNQSHNILEKFTLAQIIEENKFEYFF